MRIAIAECRLPPSIRWMKRTDWAGWMVAREARWESAGALIALASGSLPGSNLAEFGSCSAAASLLPFLRFSAAGSALSEQSITLCKDPSHDLAFEALGS